MLANFQAALPVREGQPSPSISMQPKRAMQWGMAKTIGDKLSLYVGMSCSVELGSKPVITKLRELSLHLILYPF